jgi:putative endonuclease
MNEREPGPRAISPRAARGALGETFAALFLESRGYAIVAKNLRAGRREIDLLVERGTLYVAVEVKWRRQGAVATAPGEAWRRDQRARLHEAVLLAMERLPDGASRPWRIDLIEIDESAEGIRLTHRPGAWSPGGSLW